MVKKLINFLKVFCCVIFVHSVFCSSLFAMVDNPEFEVHQQDHDTVPVTDTISLDSDTAQYTSVPDTLYQPKVAEDSVAPKDTVKYWKFEGRVLLNISQLWFENWSVGGENAIAGNTLEDFTLTYSKNNITWENTLRFASGLVKQNGHRMRKTDDRIEIISKYGRRLNRKFNYSALWSIQTQFFPGYWSEDDPDKVSDFFAPAYLNVSVGLDYRPAEKVSVYFSPVAGKITIVNSDFIKNYETDGSGAFGVKPGRLARYELGGSMVVSAKGQLFKNLYVQALGNGFTRYGEKTTDIDWSCELMLSMKLNKFFSANLKANLLYDSETSLDPQFKEFFGLGFSYKL